MAKGKHVLKTAEKHLEEGQSETGSLLRQVILGGQDGVVNVLGIILGVATATNDSRMVIIAGLAATFAESLSMAAVAFTSARAVRDYYEGKRIGELEQIHKMPDVEREEIRLLYRRKGFSGRALDNVVRTITSKKELWLRVMLEEEHGLSESGRQNPAYEAVVVGGSAFVGSLIPLAPFFFFSSTASFWLALILSLIALFIGGFVKGKLTTGDWVKGSLEMVVIGGLAAVAGYVVGALLGVAAA